MAMNLQKSMRPFYQVESNEPKYQNYFQEKPSQKTYLKETKNYELKKNLYDNASFEMKHTPTNPIMQKDEAFGLSNNKYSNKSINKEKKTIDEFVPKKDFDLSSKLKDKKEQETIISTKTDIYSKKLFDSKPIKDYENSSASIAFQKKGLDYMEKNSKSKFQEDKFDKLYSQYLKDSPEKISARKKNEPKIGIFEENYLKKEGNDDKYYKKFDFSANQKKPSYQERQIDNKEPSFQKASKEIAELKKSLVKEKNYRYGEIEKKIDEKINLNFDEKSGFSKPENLKKDWTNYDDKLRGKTLEYKTFSKQESLSIQKSPNFASKYEASKPLQNQKFELGEKSTKIEENNKDLSSYQSKYSDIKKYSQQKMEYPSKNNESYNQKNVDLYEKKLYAQEKKPIEKSFEKVEKKSNIYEKYEKEFMEKEKKALFNKEKEKPLTTIESLEIKNYTKTIDSLKEKKEELEAQIKESTQKQRGMNITKPQENKEQIELKLKLEEAQRTIYSLNNQINKLNEEVSNLEDVKLQMKASIDKYQKESQEVFVLQKEIKNIKAEVGKEQKLKESLLNDLKLSEERRKQTEMTLREANSQVEELKFLREKFERNEKTKQESQLKLKEIEDENRRLKNELQQKNQENSKFDRISQECEQLRKDHSQAKNVNQNLQEQIKALSDELNRSNSQIKTYQEQLTALHQIAETNEEFKQSHDKLMVDNKELLTQNMELNNYINQMSEQFNNHLQEIEEKEENYIKQIEELKNNNTQPNQIPESELMAIFKGFEEEKAELLGRIQELEEKNQEIVEELHSAQKGFKQQSENNTEILQLKVQIKELEAKLQDSNHKTKENEEKIGRIKNENEKISKDLSAEKEAKNKMASEIQGFIEERDQLKKEMEKQNMIFSMKLESSQEESQKLFDEICILKEKNNRLEEDNIAMAECLDEKMKNKEKNELIVEETNEKEENLQKEIAELREKNDQNEKLIENLQEERNQLENVLTEKLQNEELFEEMKNQLIIKHEIEEKYLILKEKYDLLLNQAQENPPMATGGDVRELETKIQDLEQQEEHYIEEIKDLQERLLKEEFGKAEKIKEIEKKYKDEILKLEEEKNQLEQLVLQLEENSKNEPAQNDLENNKFKMMVSEKENVIESLTKEINNKDKTISELEEAIRLFIEKKNSDGDIEFIIQEYEVKHEETMKQEIEKYEVMQEKFIKKIAILKHEIELLQEHILSNQPLQEKKPENLNNSAELQALPFLIEEYEYKFKLVLDAEKEKFKVTEEKYVNKIKELNEMINQQNF